MKVVECTGTPRQIGRATGEELREEIRRYISMIPQPDQKEWNGRFPVLRKTLKTCMPDIYDEITGMAQGAAIPVEDVLRINLPLANNELDTATDMDVGCTNIAFSAGPDGPVLGKNNDGLSPDQKKPVCVRKIAPDHGIPLVVLTICGVVATIDGMNANGVALGHSSVGSRLMQSDLNPDIRLWSYHCLSRSRSTAEFARNMLCTPLRGKGFSILCVDRDGRMCSLEAPCPLMQIRRPDTTNGMSCVNYYQLAALRDMDRRTHQGKADAHARRLLIDAILEKDVFDEKLMKATLALHGTPGICRHWEDRMHNTEYSYIALPAQGRVLYVDGYPCEQEYREIML